MAVVVQISSYEELRKIIEESGKEYDRAKIEQAYRLAEEKHQDQKRSSGEPYIIHPLSVAAILVGLGMDSESVMAGLLHDVGQGRLSPECIPECLEKKNRAALPSMTAPPSGLFLAAVEYPGDGGAS